MKDMALADSTTFGELNNAPPFETPLRQTYSLTEAFITAAVATLVTLARVPFPRANPQPSAASDAGTPTRNVAVVHTPPANPQTSPTDNVKAARERDCTQFPTSRCATLQ
jgi:hypothetical protein